MARKLRKEARGVVVEAGGRACTEEVGHAAAAQRRLALRQGGRLGTEERYDGAGRDDGRGVEEVVPLVQAHAVLVALDQVARVGRPDVVDGVEERGAAQGGAAARGEVDPVAVEGDEVATAHQLQAPVRVTIASGAVGRAARNEGVGNGDTRVGGGAKRVVLTAEIRGRNMVDPDVVGARKRDGVPTPDVLRVQVLDFNVLYNDVVDVHETEALPVQGGTVRAHKGLVRGDVNALVSSCVDGHTVRGLGAAIECVK